MSAPSDRPTGDVPSEELGAASTRPKPEPSTDKLDHAISGQMPGSVVAYKYRVEGLIGRGGMGIVVRATHLALGQEVALKLLSGSSPESAVRFAREARTVVQLKSEHIVRVIDYGEASPGKPYLVMELVRGETLAERLDRTGPVSLDDAIDWILQASLGLAEAHRAGIVHRDLKPSNLMVTERPDGSPLVKVLDFGIAKSAAAGALTLDGQASSPSPRGASMALEETLPVVRERTAAAVVLGSPFYMSPEQVASAHDVDPRTDVWALGVILHELVTGRVPFVGPDIAQVLVAIQSAPPALAFAGDDRSRAVAEAVARCLAKDPRERWASVADLAEALAPVAAEESRALVPQIARVLLRDTPSERAQRSGGRAAIAKPAAPPSPSTPPRAPSSRWPVLAAAGAGIALVAGLSGALLARGGSRGGPSTSTSPSLGGASSEPSAVSAASSASAVAAPVAPAGPCPPSMILVPADSFVMGPGTTAEEDVPSPKRIVKLGAYCIDRTEVTAAAYARCVAEPRGGLQCSAAKTAATWVETASETNKKFDQCTAGDPTKTEHPINCVDWEQATTYCRWLTPNGALPTEAQWERAARGVDGRTYPWGEGARGPKLANLCGEECVAYRRSHGMADMTAAYKADDGFPTTSPVGSYPAGASPIGALDMAGNVWEWTQDYLVPYDETALEDPVGQRPAEKPKRALRGGSWFDTMARASYRSGYSAAFSHPHTGFRCAAKPSPAGPGQERAPRPSE